MSDLNERIRAAQVHAGEQVVMADLRRRGLAEAPGLDRQMQTFNAVYEAMCAAYTEHNMTVEELVKALAANIGKVIAAAGEEGCTTPADELGRIARTYMQTGFNAWQD